MILREEMRDLLGKLEMLSHGSVQNWNSSGHGDGSDSIPVNDNGTAKGETPPHIYWRRKWDQASTDAGRQRAIDGARDELATWSGVNRERVATPDDSVVLAERILTEGAGWPVATVTVALRCSATLVRKTRMLAGRDVDTGDKTEAIGPTATLDAIEHARELLRRRVPQRAIVMLTGLSKDAVHRLSRKVA